VADEDFSQTALDHLDMLYNLARRLVPSRHEAEDLVQETYVRALRGWRRQPPRDVGPWLATICLNVARSQRRWRAVRAAEVLDPDPGAEVASSLDTAEDAMARMVGDAVHRALWKLPAAQREAIALMDLCGFTAAQVGELTGAPRGTVLARAHRGHKRLAELLEPEAVTDET
jgi:RNA polymerase sigma-70 factor (ECF subfamily)